MARPKLIPPDLYPEILSRAGKGESTETIAVWLTEKIGKKVDGRRVRAVLEKVRAERAPIAQAVVREKLAKTLGSDLDAVDGLLESSRRLEKEAAALAAQEGLSPDQKLKAMEQQRKERAEQRALYEMRMKLSGATGLGDDQGGVVLLPPEGD